MKNNNLGVVFVAKNAEVGALILRVVIGLGFLIHGVSKYSMGIDNIAGWFASLGLPGFLAYIVGTIEIVGGIALILGLGTRIFSALFILILAGAIITVKLKVGFLGDGKMAGYELDLLYLAPAAYLFINGSRLFALDALLSKNGGKQDIVIQ